MFLPSVKFRSIFSFLAQNLRLHTKTSIGFSCFFDGLRTALSNSLGFPCFHAQPRPFLTLLLSQIGSEKARRDDWDIDKRTFKATRSRSIDQSEPLLIAILRFGQYLRLLKMITSWDRNTVQMSYFEDETKVSFDVQISVRRSIDKGRQKWSLFEP